jgi:hypothetical protein
VFLLFFATSVVAFNLAVGDTSLLMLTLLMPMFFSAVCVHKGPAFLASLLLLVPLVLQASLLLQMSLLFQASLLLLAALQLKGSMLLLLTLLLLIVLASVSP